MPLDFGWPLNKVWSGFINPHHPRQCALCHGTGSSPAALLFQAEWYGHTRFECAWTGSTPFGAKHPIVQARARQNVERYPPCGPIRREAERLASQCFDNHWMHHLSQADVDALVEAGRLYDFTRTWTDGKWIPKDPPYRPTAAEVNAWSLQGFGHDSINSWVCIGERCRREGQERQCAACKGEGQDPSDAETIALSEAWTDTEPPGGEGWQMWETVSEGSPISPVFATSGELADWLARNRSDDGTREQWLRMIEGPGVAMSLVMAGGKVMSGVEAAAGLLSSESHRRNQRCE